MLLRGLFMQNRTPYTPSQTVVSTPGTSTVSVPAGALDIQIGVISGGSAGLRSVPAGGGGGSCALTTKYAIGAVTQYYITCGAGGPTEGALGGNSSVRDTNAGGTLRCEAVAGVTNNYAGGLAASCTGDIAYNGGSGTVGQAGGGGAAGITGAGGNNFVHMGGAGNAPGGRGGDGTGGPGPASAGSSVGGGGGVSADNWGAGSDGIVVIDWT